MRDPKKYRRRLERLRIRRKRKRARTARTARHYRQRGSSVHPGRFHAKAQKEGLLETILSLMLAMRTRQKKI